MTAEVAPALAETLLRHPELVALNLNDTSLTDEGVSAIAQSLHASAGSLQVQSKPLQLRTTMPDILPAVRSHVVVCATPPRLQIDGSRGMLCQHHSI